MAKRAFPEGEQVTIGDPLLPTKTRVFNGEDGNRIADELATVAERVAGESMNAKTRGEFDGSLNEAAIEFTSPKYSRQPNEWKSATE